jgi:hypothetical protein
MLAAWPQISTNSFHMAEDDMEISSDHGHDAGDEDIDIDIDFTAGHTDEDHILEDVGTHEEMQDDVQIQVGSTFMQDEEMVDEDNLSYQMDDADLLHDEDTQVGEGDTLLFQADTHLHQTDYTAILTPQPEEIEDQETLDLHSLHDVEVEPEGLPATAHVVDNDSHQDPVPESDNVSAPRGEDMADDQLQHDTRQPSPSDNAYDATKVEEPRSPPISDAKSVGSPPEFIPNSEDLEQEIADGNPQEEDAYDVVESHTSDNVNPTSIAPLIIVSWDGKEYPLFSSSDSDDPDTYFLSDTAILEKSLVVFLQAIRGVIQADLGDEDELVFSVDDLGLETSEVGEMASHLKENQLTTSVQFATSIQSVSLSQIVKLRQQLLRNNEVDDDADQGEGLVDQLYISITVKKNFSKRLSNLISGAAEGKRLSDFWEVQSQSLDDIAELYDTQQDQASAPESPLPGNPSDAAVVESDHTPSDIGDRLREESGVVAEDAAIDGTIEHDTVPEDTKHDHHDHSSHISQGKGSPTPPAEIQDLESLKGFAAPEADLSQAIDPSSHLDTGDAEITTALDGDVDEDGDFIDYSEDELEFDAEDEKAQEEKTDNDGSDQGIFSTFVTPSCALPPWCICPRCSTILLAGYDEINENSPHRSASRQSGGEQVSDFDSHPQIINDDVEAGVVEAIEDSADQAGFGFASSHHEAVEDEGEEELGYDPMPDHASNEADEYNASYVEGLNDDAIPGGNDEPTAVVVVEEEVLVEEDEEEEADEDYGVLNSDAEVFTAGAGVDLEDENPSEEPAQDQDESTATEIPTSPGVNMEGAVSNYTANSVTGSIALDTAESSVTLGADDIVYDEEEEDAEEAAEAVEAEDEVADGLIQSATEVSSGGAEVASLEQKDEIDYEDDEEEEAERLEIIRSGHSLQDIKESSPASGKRTIAEVDFDDILDTRSTSECCSRIRRRRHY